MSFQPAALKLGQCQTQFAYFPPGLKKHSLTPLALSVSEVNSTCTCTWIVLFYPFRLLKRLHTAHHIHSQIVEADLARRTINISYTYTHHLLSHRELLWDTSPLLHPAALTVHLR